MQNAIGQAFFSAEGRHADDVSVALSVANGCLDMDVLMPRAHGRAVAATLGITLRFGTKVPSGHPDKFLIHQWYRPNCMKV